MSANQAEQIVDAFIAAMEAGDADAAESLLHSDIQVYYNFMPSLPKPEFIELQRKVDSAATRKLTLIERQVAGNRVIQRHQLCLTTHAGVVNIIDAALFLTVENGLITEMGEYLDSAQLNHDLLKDDAAASAT